MRVRFGDCPDNATAGTRAEQGRVRNKALRVISTYVMAGALKR